MRYRPAPIHCRPWLLNGLSPRLIESHYENNYGGALRRLNAITDRLGSLELAATPGFVVAGLKREQLAALNSTLLHELHFASLGGDGKPPPAMAEAPARDFGSVDRWRDELVAMAHALAGSSGWVLHAHVPRDRRLVNQYASEHAQAIAGGIPILALDMYEHAYPIDFGANAKAYVDAFMRNVDWSAVAARCEDATKVEPPRPRHYVSRTQDIMQGAVWRDPDRVDEWAGELSKSEPVVVFCAYRFRVGCRTALALGEAGFDVEYTKGGHSAWKAMGGPTRAFA